MNDIEATLEELFADLEKAKIPVDELFANTDGGFEAEMFKDSCFKQK